MLPLHSQNTAAIYISIEQVILTIIKVRNVFNKQTGKIRELTNIIKLLI